VSKFGISEHVTMFYIKLTFLFELDNYNFRSFGHFDYICQTGLPNLVRKRRTDFKLLLFVLREIQFNVTFLTSIAVGQRCLKMPGHVIY